MKPARPRPAATVQGPPCRTGGAPLPQRVAMRERGEGAQRLRGSYFKLIVVFTPWPAVLSSNQRAVTVLVWV